MDLADATYDVMRSLPRYESYGLADQLRRSAVSVASNIAEGHGRLHRGDYVHHLSMARGSLAELQTQLQLACRLHGTDVTAAVEVANVVGRMLNRLIARLRALPPNP